MKKYFRLFLQGIFIGIFCYSAFNLGMYGWEVWTSAQATNKMREVVKEEVKEVKTDLIDFKIPNYGLDIFTKQKFDDLKNINKDIIGYLHFDSGLISEAVTQTTNNDYYLYRDIYGNYNKFGTIFVDYENLMEDTNLSLYGHSSSTISTSKFQPINNMYRNKEMLKDNRYFSLYTDKEIRRYETSYIFYYGEFWEYDHRDRNFATETDFNEFKNWVSNRAIYLNDNIKYGDKFISLQACLDWDNSRRVILVAKEIERLDY